MTRILLTGAGFSRNWGGWLASEAFEYLLGCSEIDDETRRLLWRSKDSGAGFEDTLADLASANDDQSKMRLKDLTDALVGMFNAMGQGFKERQFEFQDTVDLRYAVKTFLDQFDAIFTLNQDTLLEQHYLNEFLPGGWRRPGLKPLNLNIAMAQHDKIAPQQPDPPSFNLNMTFRPYIKLHGSCNWMEGPSGGRILIMGGQKAISINQFPILSWYHDLFRQFLSRPNVRLMVIGYSFSDTHINDIIGDGVKRELKIFIIDPCGVDVLDKRPKRLVVGMRDEYMEKLAPHIIGASRRLLTAIFDNDRVEHGRIMKFFS
jgi:hypothetical protein